MTDQLAMAMFVAGGAAFTTLAQVFRESRKRKWDKQDRREVADALVVETARVATKNAEAVLHKLAQNTDISVKAFAVANEVNEKFFVIHRRLDGIEAVIAGKADRV